MSKDQLITTKLEQFLDEGNTIYLGDWCEILPWNPMNEGHAHDHSRWLRSNSDTVFEEIGEDGEDNQSK